MPLSARQPPLVIPAPLGASTDDRRVDSIADLELLARWMDSAFEIPGVGVQFGFDAILGLIPGVGDAGASLVSLYVLHRAHRLGVGRSTLWRMAANVAIDFVGGAVPLAGDVFDVYWKANRRNVELLRRHATAAPAEAKRLRFADHAFVFTLIAALVVLAGCCVVGAIYVVSWLGTFIASLGK